MRKRSRVRFRLALAASLRLRASLRPFRRSACRLPPPMPDRSARENDSLGGQSNCRNTSRLRIRWCRAGKPPAHGRCRSALQIVSPTGAALSQGTEMDWLMADPSGPFGAGMPSRVRRFWTEEAVRPKRRAISALEKGLNNSSSTGIHLGRSEPKVGIPCRCRRSDTALAGRLSCLASTSSRMVPNRASSALLQRRTFGSGRAMPNLIRR